MSDTDLAHKLSKSHQCLCIVNRRKHAQKIYRKLPENHEENFHLSALMCPAHRREILSKVTNRLDLKKPVRLVSTQLIEAGVDVDFPVVYRSLAGIDSIAQAAGRCNRNGKLDRLGEVFVFEAEDQKAEAYFKETAQVAAQVLELHDDILCPAAIKRYFDLYYYKQKSRWDEKLILEEFTKGSSRDLPFLFQYKTASSKFEIIESGQQAILIPYNDEAKMLINQLKDPYRPVTRDLTRKLQWYTIQIRPNEMKANINIFEPIRDEQFYALISKEANYSDQFGLNYENDSLLNV